MENGTDRTELEREYPVTVTVNGSAVGAGNGHSPAANGHASADLPESNSAEAVTGTEAAAAEPVAIPVPRPPRRRVNVLAHFRWLLGVLLIVFLIRTFVGEATIIPTASMENTILVGDHVFLNKALYGPHIPFTEWKLPALKSVQRQDIIAFRYPRDPAMIYVKRVIGVPGDRLEIQRGMVVVNGQRLDEPYVVHTHPIVREQFGPVTVPAGHYFVMGDNRDNSHDSRFWGTVPEGNIIGEPLVVYWSYEAPSDAWLREGAMNRARFYASVAANFFSKTRWSRTGHRL